jgi:hypothetical protein
MSTFSILDTISSFEGSSSSGFFSIGGGDSFRSSAWAEVVDVDDDDEEEEI